MEQEPREEEEKQECNCIMCRIERGKSDDRAFTAEVIELFDRRIGTHRIREKPETLAMGIFCTFFVEVLAEIGGAVDLAVFLKHFSRLYGPVFPKLAAHIQTRKDEQDRKAAEAGLQ